MTLQHEHWLSECFNFSFGDRRTRVTVCDEFLISKFIRGQKFQECVIYIFFCDTYKNVMEQFLNTSHTLTEYFNLCI